MESVAGDDDTPTAPAMPQGVAATHGERCGTNTFDLHSGARNQHDGEIILSWKAVANAYCYIVESSFDPSTATSWTHVAIATAANKSIGNLTSGKRYWFRVKTVGAAGESGWSEHASKVVP